MIYLFTGDDTKKKRASYEKFIKFLPTDKAGIPKGVETFFISKNNFDPMQIESFYSGSGLFFAKCAIIFDNILEREETLNFILEKLLLIGESKNDFIFLEGKLNKSVLNAFKNSKSEVSIFELPKAKKEKYDNFILANDFGNRDKLNLWIHYREAMDKGVMMEELVGVLFWKVKDMILKNNFGKFKEEELQNFASKISYLLPEARKEGRDAETAFEQFLLEAF